MPLTLLVLAAGMGSRYGGLKQLEPVGPSGETLLDYAVYDAVRAGFDRVVFVVRHDFADVFRDRVASKYAGHVQVDYAFQSLSSVPAGCLPIAGREKPLGTGHATWCARDVVRDSFVVINADDFYGRDAFARLAVFLRAARTDEAAMAGFRLDRTLSENGTVSRGICTVTDNGLLSSVVECTGIAVADVGPGRKFSGAEIVSMNCWAFSPAIFPMLDDLLREFLRDVLPAAPGKAEFYLPAAVSNLISGGKLRTSVLPVEGDWFGVTYREDRPRVCAAIARLVEAGNYPQKLF